jgi:hypothetical protein
MKTKDFVKKFSSKYLWGNIAAMIGVVMLMFVCLIFGLQLYTRHGEGVAVPNIKGMNFNDAQRLLEERGLKIVVNDSGYNRKMPADYVLAQVPGVGVEVKEGHIVYVTVNSPSSPTLTIPDIIDNSSLREAQAKLTAMGFKLLEPEYVHGEKDWVYGIKSRGHNLYTGDNVSAEIPIMLLVGDGQFDSGSDDIDYTDAEAGQGEQDDFQEVGASEENGKSETKKSPKINGKYNDKVDESGLSD